MLEDNVGMSLEVFPIELPEIPRERGFLVLNSAPFDIFVKELPEGPEGLLVLNTAPFDILGKHWLASDRLTLTPWLTGSASCRGMPKFLWELMSCTD